jgi:membrane peptidoglycan carboxypeptidase
MIFYFITNNLKKLFVIFFYLIFPIFFSTILFFFEKSYFSLISHKPNISYSIYDSHNNIIKNYYNIIEYNKIPKNLINAFISIEDTEFFYHYGFSIKSIIRSFLQNIKKGSFVQGGSTITQQYVKLYNGDLKKTYSRKIKELLISIILELCYTKEEIFQSYCNILYFGKNIIGISECARVLFNKNYTDLSLDECAMVAGIVQRPEYYNPIKNKNAAINRKNYVLKVMLREHHITKKEYEEAFLKDTVIFSNNFFNTNKSIYQSIECDIKKLNLPLNHEYIISTSIDLEIHTLANKLFNEEILKLKKHYPEIEGSLIISNYRTGKIVSIINGYNLYKNTNRVFNWYRQIGSIIKPYIMYYALLNGDTINTLYSDTPLESIFKWNPKNNSKKFKGDITIEEALFQSNNIIPIRIISKYGINKFISLLQPFFKNNINPFLSLSLGCIECSIFEISTLFNTFLNDGKKQDLSYIEKIIKKSGGIIYENPPKKIDIYFKKSESDSIKNILKKIGNYMKIKNNIPIKSDIYAKTGTTNDAVSCWFVCANETYSIVICLGADDNTKLSQYNIRSTNSAVPLGLNILNEVEKL